MTADNPPTNADRISWINSLPLSRGQLCVEFPSELTIDDVADMEDLFKLILRQSKRRVQSTIPLKENEATP